MTLQPTERNRFNFLKQVVKDGMLVCIVVGEALREIKEMKFYEADGFATFKDFCEQEMKLTQRYCNQLITDADIVKSLPSSIQIFITSGKAARALAGIPAPLLPEVVKAAAAGGKPVTAKAIKAAPPKLPHPPPRKKPAPPARKPAPAGPLPRKQGLCDPTGCEIP